MFSISSDHPFHHHHAKSVYHASTISCTYITYVGIIIWCILCVVYHLIWDKVLHNILISVSVIWRNGNCTNESRLTFCLFLFDSNFYPIRFLFASIAFVDRSMDFIWLPPRKKKDEIVSYAHHKKTNQRRRRKKRINNKNIFFFSGWCVILRTALLLLDAVSVHLSAIPYTNILLIIFPFLFSYESFFFCIYNQFDLLKSYLNVQTWNNKHNLMRHTAKSWFLYK